MNTVVKSAFLFLFTLASASYAFDTEANAPSQPIEFNHKLHVTDQKVPCQTCHANPNPGEMMGMPEVSTCNGCHAAHAPKTAGERKLSAFAKQQRDVDWLRVYQIPTFVSFSHRTHIQAGTSCQTCHGPVAERTRLWKEVDTSMGSCMDCHRTHKASIDCNTCHSPR